MNCAGGQTHQSAWKKGAFIVFSYGAPIHNNGLGTIKFHKCGVKINTEGSVSQFYKLELCLDL